MDAPGSQFDNLLLSIEQVFQTQDLTSIESMLDLIAQLIDKHEELVKPYSDRLFNLLVDLFFNIHIPRLELYPSLILTFSRIFKNSYS